MCHRIKSVYILRLTNTNEKCWHLDDESSLDSRDAHFVEIGVEGLETDEELLLEETSEHGPNAIFVHELIRDLLRDNLSRLCRLITFRLPSLIFWRSCCCFDMIG